MLSLKLLYKSPLGNILNGWRKLWKREVTRALDDPDLDKDPLRAEYVRSIPEAQMFRGILLQGYLAPASVLEGLDEMEIREEDVFIITYPKSGTTWTEEIVSSIYAGGDVQKVAKELLVYRVHHLEVGRPFGQLRFLRRLRSPRLMATHLQLNLAPSALHRPTCKIIYVMRNPKDTAVSYYHHHKMSTFLGNSTATWDQFLAYFMAGYVVYGSWFDHVLPYWELCKLYPNNVFFLSYEELKLDLHGMIRRLCDFLERPLSESEIQKIVQHCSFEEMKTNKMVNREYLPISDLFDMTKTKFMRKGIVGDWKNYFTEEQSRLFDTLFKTQMSHSDLQVVFEVHDAVRLFEECGRIIYNHPEKILDFEDSDDENQYPYPTKLQYQPRFLSKWVPPVQLHLQPDPITLDAVG